MTKPINKYDKCKNCGHSNGYDHKSSWGTTTCDACPNCKGCNYDNGWGTEPIDKNAEKLICKNCSKPLYKEGYSWTHIKSKR